MNKRFSIASVCIVIVAAGSAVGTSSLAEPPQPARDKSSDRASPMRTFVSGDSMLGMNIDSPTDESLGAVDDLIIDRGSGKIAYVVMKSGTILGMGGKHVVVPSSALGWDHVDKHLTLNSTKDQIKTWPEFKRDQWAAGARDEGSLVRSLASEYY